MKQFNKIPYYIYMSIGVVYVVVKIIFVSAGYLYPGAILHGVIPAILTLLTAILSLKERSKNYYIPFAYISDYSGFYVYQNGK